MNTLLKRDNNRPTAMSDILDVSSIIDDEGAISSFTALLGRPFEEVNPKDDVGGYGEPNISWVELQVKKKKRKFSFRFQGRRWEAIIGNYLFFDFFINQLSDKNIPFFFKDDTLSYDEISDINYSIVIHDCVEFRFEVDSNVLMLTRISVFPKFTPNKYLQFDMLKRFNSIG